MPDFSELERKVFDSLQREWYDGFDSIIARENELKRLSSECARLADTVNERDFLTLMSYQQEVDRQIGRLEDVKIAAQEVVEVPFGVHVAQW